MSDKPVQRIKTALERFQSYCAAKGIPEKSSLAHIHKISQFEEHERKELRAAYEALKAENGDLRIKFDAAIDSVSEQFQICKKLKAENEKLKQKNEDFREHVKKLEAEQKYRDHMNSVKF